VRVRRWCMGRYYNCNMIGFAQQEARRRVRTAKGNTTATQEVVLAVIDDNLSSSTSDAMDAGLANWAEGEQLYQPDEVANEAGW
jgi:hypothetical protein